jgi:hypothetical protein
MSYSNTNAFVAQSVWDLAAYKIYDIVWVPVMLMIKETRDIPVPSVSAKKVNVRSLREDFSFWPAVIQNIFTVPYKVCLIDLSQELWYGPLCIEEVQPNRLQVISTQVFKHITKSHIRFAYSIKLVNLNVNADIVLAEDELRPYLYKPKNYPDMTLTENEISRFRQLSSDFLLVALINALNIAENRARKVHRLNDDEVVPPRAAMPEECFEIESFLFGPEVIRTNDIIRVKVRIDQSQDFQSMYFKVNAILCNKATNEITLHGFRLYIQPLTEEDTNREFAFMSSVSDQTWRQYENTALYKDYNRRKMLSVFKITSDTLYQIQLERILGRFYQGFPDFGLELHVDVV